MYSVDNIELTAECMSCDVELALNVANFNEFGSVGHSSRVCSAMADLAEYDHDMFLWYSEKCSFINHTTSRGGVQCFAEVIHPVIH